MVGFGVYDVINMQESWVKLLLLILYEWMIACQKCKWIHDFFEFGLCELMKIAEFTSFCCFYIQLGADLIHNALFKLIMTMFNRYSFMMWTYLSRMEPYIYFCWIITWNPLTVNTIIVSLRNEELILLKSRN